MYISASTAFETKNAEILNVTPLDSPIKVRKSVVT